MEQLRLYSDKDANMSQTLRYITINFMPCSCPIGFQPKSDKGTINICECVCDLQLHRYFIKCTRSLTREGSFWINLLINDTTNSSGCLVHHHCPLDYCLPPESTVAINLNIPNGADAQCARIVQENYGACQSGLSLSLGSTHCISCSNSWPSIQST